MKNKFNLINRYPVILGVALLVISTFICWRVFLSYGIASIYYFSIVIYLVCVPLFLVGAYKYRDRKAFSIILLTSASLIFVLACFDFYLITFNYDTSGPGGKYVITHCNWYNSYVSNNEWGFWERSIAEFNNPPERKDQIVIAVVGDSFTWGQGIKGKKFRFTERLEKKLNSTSGGKKVSVLNFGRGGADTLQEIEIVNKFLSKIHPDMVLLCYLSNDILFKCGLEDYDKTWERLSTIIPTVNLIYWRLVSSVTFKDVGRKYMEIIVNSYNDADTFKKHMHDLQIFFTDARRIGAKPVFVLLPFRQMWQLFPEKTRDDIYNRIKKSVKLDGVPVIDLTYIEKKYTLDDFVVNAFDAHPNENIHEEFAEAIYSWLSQNKEYKQLLDKK